MKSSRKPIAAMAMMPTQMISAWVLNGRPSRTWAANQPTERGDEDRDAAHRRRALLGHVVLGAAVLLAEDRLAEPARAEQGDQRPRGEQRDDAGDDAGDHDAIIDGVPVAALGRTSRATSRSSKASTWSPIVCVRLVALAGDDHHVAGLGERDRGADRLGAVGLDLDPGAVVGRRRRPGSRR